MSKAWTNLNMPILESSAFNAWNYSAIYPVLKTANEVIVHLSAETWLSLYNINGTADENFYYFFSTSSGDLVGDSWLSYVEVSCIFSAGQIGVRTMAKGTAQVYGAIDAVYYR